MGCTQSVCICFVIVLVMAGVLFDSYGFEWTFTGAALASIFIGTILLVILVMFGNGPVTLRVNDGNNKRSGDDNIS